MINLRPHHGMCIGQFVGNGYSGEFTANMQRIIERLEACDTQSIKLVCHVDDICGSCPHNHEGICRSGQKVMNYDAACLTLCGIRENEEISWRDFKDKVRASILETGKLKEVCEGCQWIDTCLQNMGINY